MFDLVQVVGHEIEPVKQLDLIYQHYFRGLLDILKDRELVQVWHSLNKTKPYSPEVNLP